MRVLQKSTGHPRTIIPCQLFTRLNVTHGIIDVTTVTHVWIIGMVDKTSIIATQNVNLLGRMIIAVLAHLSLGCWREGLQLLLCENHIKVWSEHPKTSSLRDKFMCDQANPV